ncbi:MAG: zf-HC2 domain-containing protein [Acidobacteria bacterium]|nr:zf-HC2 domain-containing protein [Acidobacteriota bacterium]
MKAFISCKQCTDLLMDYLEGTLDTGIKQRLDEHLSACPPCLNFLRTYKTSSELTRRLRDQQVQIPRAMENRLKSFLREQVKKS